MNDVMNNNEKRVAIIGARGIGRHHARWWDMEGADVSAIVGTSRKSVEVAGQHLAASFGFNGREYTNIERMLEEEEPDYVDVCTPPDLHNRHVRLALKANCHVLCEKPMIFDASLDDQTMLSQAQELVILAKKKALILALSAQYAIAAGWCALLASPDKPIANIAATIGSPVKQKNETPADTWIDLGPHLLSILQALVPGAHIERNTLKAVSMNDAAVCEADLLLGKRRIRCKLKACRTEETPTHIRSIAINGINIDIEGYRDKAGVYSARLISSNDKSETHNDPLRVLIRKILQGNPSIPAAMAIDNERMLLRVARELGR